MNELRAAETPFYDYNDLLREYSLEKLDKSKCRVEFIVFQAAAVDIERCKFNQVQATISVRLLKNLERDLFSLGILHRSEGEDRRYTVRGNEFLWSDEEIFSTGEISIPVKMSDTLLCFANFNKINYGHYWLRDPSSTNNARHSTFSAFDPELSVIREYLFPKTTGKTKSREFEIGVHWLFWMMGFSPIMLDAQHGLSEVPDNLLCDSLGRFILLESTVDRVSNKEKLEKLAQRHQQLRKQLHAHELDHVESVPTIVTRLDRSEILDLDHAK